MTSICNIHTAVFNVICYSCVSFSYFSAITERRRERKKTVSHPLNPRFSPHYLMPTLVPAQGTGTNGEAHEQAHGKSPGHSAPRNLCSYLGDKVSLKHPRAVTDLSLQIGMIAQPYPKTPCEPQGEEKHHQSVITKTNF